MRISVFFDHILQAMEQTGKSLTEILSGVQKTGIDAVEINLQYLIEHEEVLLHLKQANLDISCIYEVYDMAECEEESHAKNHIETAVKVGAGRILVVPGFLSEEESLEMGKCMDNYEDTVVFMDNNKKIQHMLMELNYIAHLGKQQNVLVTIEDYDDRKSPVSRINGIQYFLKHVPDLTYTLDMGNFVYSGENVLAAWDVLKYKVAHVHCKDRGTNLGEKHGLLSVAVGDGYLPIAELVQKLKAMGYDGYLAIEHFDAPDQKTCIRRSAQYLKGLLET